MVHLLGIRCGLILVNILACVAGIAVTYVYCEGKCNRRFNTSIDIEDAVRKLEPYILNIKLGRADISDPDISDVLKGLGVQSIQRDTDSARIVFHSNVLDSVESLWWVDRSTRENPWWKNKTQLQEMYTYRRITTHWNYTRSAN